jgi:hypothetical protein
MARRRYWLWWRRVRQHRRWPWEIHQSCCSDISSKKFGNFFDLVGRARARAPWEEAVGLRFGNQLARRTGFVLFLVKSTRSQPLMSIYFFAPRRFMERPRMLSLGWRLFRLAEIADTTTCYRLIWWDTDVSSSRFFSISLVRGLFWRVEVANTAAQERALVWRGIDHLWLMEVPKVNKKGVESVILEWAGHLR